MLLIVHEAPLLWKEDEITFMSLHKKRHKINKMVSTGKSQLGGATVAFRTSQNIILK